MSAGVIITKHVIEQWRERTGSQKDDDSIREKIFSLFEKSAALIPDECWAAKKLISHGYKPTHYYSFRQWIFVIVEDGGSHKMVTVMDGAKNKKRFKGGLDG